MTRRVLEVQAAACEAIPADCKLVVTMMGGSSIEGQLGLLEHCSMDADVCAPKWARGRDPDGEIVVAGELPPEDPTITGSAR